MPKTFLTRISAPTSPRAARAAMLYAYAQIEAAVMAPKVTSNGRAVSVAGEVFGLH
jgi:hypothetical protein